MSLFAELKRRNIFRVAAAYLVIGWLAVQVIDVLAPLFEISTGFQRGVVLLMLVGFIPVLFFTWAYEITAEGIKKEEDINRDDSLVAHTAKKLNIITLVAVIAAGVMFTYQLMNPASTATSSLSEDQIAKTDSAAPGQVVVADTYDRGIRTAAETNSIAVLPFVNMSSDKEQEYFADGISEEILNALVKAKGLRVAGRTSSFSFKGKDDTIKQIGTALNVAHILEGSVRKQGKQVRITAQLIKADDEFHLWSETYDGRLDNIFDLQETISRKVTNELKVILNLTEDERLASDLTDNIDAYDLFLRGRQAVDKRVNGALEKGMELLQQAVKLDPDFAEAWASLAEAEGVSEGYITQTAQQQEAATRRALEYANKAIALDSELALPHAVLGAWSMDNDEFLKAIDEFNQALEIEPNNSIAIRWLANAYAIVGRNDLAFPLHEKAYRLDPLSTVNTYNLAAGFYKKKQFDESIRFYRITGDLRGNQIPDIAHVYYDQGKTKVAKEQYRRAVEEYSANNEERFISGADLDIFIDGLFSNSEQVKTQARTSVPSLSIDGDDVAAWQLLDHSQLNDFDRAFGILQQKPGFFGTFAADYMWLPSASMKKFRADPRLRDLLVKHRVPEVWQAIGWPELCQPNPGTDGNNGQFGCH